MEIFCNEEEELRMGEFSDSLNLIVVAHGLMNDRAKEKLLKLRKDRLTKVTERLGWLRVYHNTYNSDEFIAFLGFIDQESFNRVRDVGDFLLEEYLLTGLRKRFGMSYLASYNQFLCTPLLLMES